MKIFSKKLIASILAIIMCLSSVAFVSAEDSDVINISATETTTINTANDMICANGMENHNGSGNYAFCTSATATATINVEAAGYYTVEVTGDVRSAKCAEYKLLIDEVEADSFKFWGNNGGLYTIEVCDIYLEEGEHDLKLAYVAPASVYNYLTEIKLTKKELETDSVWVLAKNGTALSGSGAAHEMFYTSVGGAVSYTVNVPETGSYMMAMKVARVDDATNNYTVKVNGTAVKGTMGQLPQNNKSTDPFNGLQLMADMCVVNLNEGDNTIEFTNNGSFMYFSYFKFDKVDENSDDDSEPTEEPSINKDPIGEQIRTPMNSFKNSSSLSKDDWVSFNHGDWAEFDVDIPSTGYYRFGIKFGGFQDMLQRFKVYVNGKEELDATLLVEYDFFEPGDVVIGDILFTESGTNTLKIENTDSYGLLVEDFYLQLVEEVVITPEPTEAPTEAPEVEAMGENIRIHMRDYIAASSSKAGSELGQDGSNPDNTLLQVNDWAEYALNITTPGSYEFGLTMAGPVNNAQSITVEVDGKLALTSTKNTTNTTDYGEKSDVVFGNLMFATPGIHTIKIKKTDGTFAYSSHVFLNLTDSSEIRIPTGSYVEANSSRVSGALDYEGGYYCLRSGDWATYNVNILTPGKYKLGIKESGNTGQTAKLKASVNGVEQFNNNSKTPLSGMWAEFADVEYGEVTFTYAGANELTIENTGMSDGEYTIEIFLVLLEELDAGADIPDVPETTEIRLHMANDSFEKYCNMTGANDLKIEGGCVTWHGKEDSSHIGDWAKFKVNIEDPGTYRFGLELSGTVGGTTALRVEVDGEEKIESTSRTMTSYYGTLTDTEFGIIEFPEAGEYELYVEHTGLAGQYVGHIILTHLGDALEISGVKAGEVDLMEENVIPVGTDIFMVNFSKLIRNSDVTGENGQIALKDSNGKNIEISASVVKATAVIAIKEALKLDETYTLSVGAISDSVENSVSIPAKFTFTTEEGDATAFIRDAVALFKENVAEITATMFSSQNIGIKGRAFEIYLEYPNGDVSDKAIATGISGENGAIEFTYTLPSDGVDGKYTFIVGGEYVGTEAKATAVYVSPSLRENIEDALNDASTANDVKDVLEDNKDYLSFDPKKAVAGLDEEKVYAHFTEKDTDFEDIANDFAKYVAIEKLNQATSSNIGDILDDAENWEAMGLDKNMYNVLTTEKSLVKDAILALDDDLTADEFINALNDIIQNSLRKETSKTSLTPDVSDDTVYTGQGIYLPIDFVEEFEGLKKISYEISVSDSDMLENSKVKLNVPADVEIDITDEILKAEVIFDETVSNGKLGNIIITAPEKTGDYSVTVKGEIEYLYEVGDISLIIEAAVNEKDVEITVVKTPSNSSGGNSSSSANPNYRPSTGGGNGGSGNSGSAPVVTPPAPEKYAFSDIASNHWAYPAVDYLVESGVIEKTADKRFNPETAISREEIVKMIVLALGLTDVNAETTLTDVSKDNPYYVYIASAEKNGIINGNDAGEFMLGSQLTREDICVIIHRAVSSKLSFEANGDAFADDASISDYAKTAVYEMRGSGLINGMGNNEFAPKGTVTKAQTAKMIYEIVKAVAK